METKKVARPATQPDMKAFGSDGEDEVEEGEEVEGGRYEERKDEVRLYETKRTALSAP